MPADAESVAVRLIDAFGAIDLERMRSLLADDLHAYITNSREASTRSSGAAQ